MKNVIESSIFIKGLGKGPAVKTIFSIQDESEKSSPKYFDLQKLSGKKISLEYSYTEEGEDKFAKTILDVPVGLTEVLVKDFILAEISK